MTTHAGNKPAGLPCWYDLMTPDAAKSREFYAKLFGWDYFIGGPETNFYAMAHLQGRVIAGIGQPPPQFQRPSVWTVYWSSDDVNVDSQRAVALGATQTLAPMTVPTQGSMSRLVDPVGAEFGIWQAINHHGFGATGEHGTHVWTEVATPDAERARGFYAALFGLKVNALNPDMFVFDRGSGPIAGVWRMHHLSAHTPAHWVPYFGVNDTDAVVRLITAHRGKVLSQPKDTPFGRSASVADPFGAGFSIISVKA